MEKSSYFAEIFFETITKTDLICTIGLKQTILTFREFKKLMLVKSRSDYKCLLRQIKWTEEKFKWWENFRNLVFEKLGYNNNFFQDIFTKRKCPKFNRYCTSVKFHQGHIVPPETVLYVVLFHLNPADHTTIQTSNNFRRQFS